MLKDATSIIRKIRSSKISDSDKVNEKQNSMFNKNIGGKRGTNTINETNVDKDETNFENVK